MVLQALMTLPKADLPLLGIFFVWTVRHSHRVYLSRCLLVTATGIIEATRSKFWLHRHRLGQRSYTPLGPKNLTLGLKRQHGPLSCLYVRRPRTEVPLTSCARQPQALHGRFPGTVERPPW